MNHSSNRYDDSPDSWPIRSSCGGGCGGGASRMGVSQMPQRWDESWQPDYVPRAPANPRMAMSRFSPDDQPDAVSPVFSRSGLERPVSPRYDDSPDSPSFYEPRIHQTMQPPGMQMQIQRPWDDGPDSPNFYGQPVPPVVQPSGMLRSWDDSPDAPTFYTPRIPQAIQLPRMQRPWDDGPDTDNFYNQRSSVVTRRSPEIVMPWEEQPALRNAPGTRDPRMRQVSRFQPWDDLPDSDNFYARATGHLPIPMIQQNPTIFPNKLGLDIYPEITARRLSVRADVDRTCPSNYPWARQPDGIKGMNTPWSHFMPYPIPLFYNDPYLQTGAFYGRAIANLWTIPRHGDPARAEAWATGWNTGGPFLVISAHSDWPGADYTARFGRYNTGWAQPTDSTPNHITQGAIDLAYKLQELGIPLDRIVSINGIPMSGNNSLNTLLYLMNYECHLAQTFLADSRAFLPFHQHPPQNFCAGFGLDRLKATRDISFYRCAPHIIRYKLLPNPADNRIETVTVWPSNLFGHIPIVTQRHTKFPSRASGSPMYILAHNYYNEGIYNRFQEGHVYLGIGEFVQSLDAAIGRAHSCKGPIFEGTKYYLREGSSGGAIMMPSDVFVEGNTIRFLHHRAQAVHSGRVTAAGGTGGSYFPDEAQRYTLDAVPFFVDPDFLSSNDQLRPISVGVLVPGRDRSLACPTGFAAAGLVGTSLSLNSAGNLNDRKNRAMFVGNLGLVCMPYGVPFAYAANFSRAGVVSSGSIDVSVLSYLSSLTQSLDLREITTNNMVPLDIYMNEYLSTYAMESREALCGTGIQNLSRYSRSSYKQNLTMCPPGYYLRSIRFRTHSIPLIGKVSEIQCRSWDGTRFWWRTPDIGSNTLIEPSHDYLLDCGNDSVLTRLDVNANEWLYGVKQFGCKKARPF